jgi:hypothetical protein
MERNPEEEQPTSREQGEILRINSIVIPADEGQSLDQHQLKPASLADYQELVGGYIEAVDLTHPPARMYVNEEGKLRGMPVNRRATMLLWMHNRAFRYGDIIAGDAFLVGPVGRGSNDTTVPDEYTRVLFEAQSFHVEVQMHGDQEQRRQMWPFESWDEAYGFALGWAMGPDNHQRPEVADIWIVPDL